MCVCVFVYVCVCVCVCVFVCVCVCVCVCDVQYIHNGMKRVHEGYNYTVCKKSYAALVKIEHILYIEYV